MSTIWRRWLPISAAFDVANAKLAVALRTGMVGYGAAVGQPSEGLSPVSLHAKRPSIATRPVATVAGTGVTTRDTQ